MLLLQLPPAEKSRRSSSSSTSTRRSLYLDDGSLHKLVNVVSSRGMRTSSRRLEMCVRQSGQWAVNSGQCPSCPQKFMNLLERKLVNWPVVLRGPISLSLSMEAKAKARQVKPSHASLGRSSSAVCVCVCVPERVN